MKTTGLVYLGVLVLVMTTRVAWGADATDTLLGTGAGASLSSGKFDTFIGCYAGYWNTTGDSNTFLGMSAGNSNTTGGGNTFLGDEAGALNTTGFSNTFLGDAAGRSTTTGIQNTFLGTVAGYSNTTGHDNTFVGFTSGFSNTIGYGNVCIGFRAGHNETGSNKLYIDNSGTSTPLIYGEFDNRIVSIDGSLGVKLSIPNYDLDVSSGGVSKSSLHFSKDGTDTGGWITSVLDNNFFLSSGAMYDEGAGGWIQKSSDHKSVYAGSGAVGYSIYLQSNGTVGQPVSSALRFRIDYNGNVGIGVATPTYPIHHSTGARLSAGGNWVNASSRDYKDDIQELTTEKAMETLKELTPVTFRYKTDPEETHVGFIAEDVPDLVASGDRKGLSPMDIVAVLTKALQEQQRAMEELKAKVRRLESQEETRAGLGGVASLALKGD